MGLLLLLNLCWLSTTVVAVEYDIQVQEWQVPWPDTRPRDPSVDSNGLVWFCGQSGNYIANFNPQTALFKRIELPDNTHPHNLIIDSEDNIWYAGNRNNHIGKLNPLTGEITQIPMPGKVEIDPHTLVFNSSQDIWFTAQWGNKVGFLQRDTHKVTLVDMPVDNARPYGIKVDYDDVPWIVLFGSNKLASIDPRSFALSMVDLPDKKERPRRLEITQDNAVYYVDHQLGYLGHYSPQTKAIQRWQVPIKSKAKLYGSAIDNDDKIWLALTGPQPNQLVIFDTLTKVFIASVEVKSGAGSIRHMYLNPADNTVWFGTDANTIGNARLNKSSP